MDGLLREEKGSLVRQVLPVERLARNPLLRARHPWPAVRHRDRPNDSSDRERQGVIHVSSRRETRSTHGGVVLGFAVAAVSDALIPSRFEVEDEEFSPSKVRRCSLPRARSVSQISRFLFCASGRSEANIFPFGDNRSV